MIYCITNEEHRLRAEPRLGSSGLYEAEARRFTSLDPGSLGSGSKLKPLSLSSGSGFSSLSSSLCITTEKLVSTPTPWSGVKVLYFH